MKALYAGSFDPFTIGHESIVRRTLCIFDSIVIGVGYNESKSAMYDIAERVDNIKKIFSGHENIEVGSYTGLTVDYAKEKGCKILVRGVRNAIDYEKERELAEINREISGIETIILPADPALSFVSSSMVRELIHNGYDAGRFIAGNNPK